MSDMKTLLQLITKFTLAILIGWLVGDSRVDLCPLPDECPHDLRPPDGRGQVQRRAAALPRLGLPKLVRDLLDLQDPWRERKRGLQSQPTSLA